MIGEGAITRTAARAVRGIWARTNNDLGFKINAPDGWVTDNGPVWWWGTDNPQAYDGYAGNGYAAITKACSLIVNRLATSDWIVGGTTPRWVSDPMLCRPDNRYPISPARSAALRLPGPIFYGQWIRSALMWGMGWMLYAEDSDGLPLPGSMHLLNPFSIEVNGPDGGLRALVYNDGSREVLDDENRVPGTQYRLLELRNPMTPIDATTGTAPGQIQYHAAEMGLLPALANYSAGTYNGAGVPSGFIKVNNPQLTQPQADELKQQWLKAHGGGRRSVAILTSAMDYTPISVSPVDAALADMKRLSLVDVANAFCVPLFMLGAPAGHSNVYSNVETEQKALWVHTLYPWAKVIEATISALLPTGTNLEISLPPLEGMPG